MQCMDCSEVGLVETVENATSYRVDDGAASSTRISQGKPQLALLLSTWSRRPPRKVRKYSMPFQGP